MSKVRICLIALLPCFGSAPRAPGLELTAVTVFLSDGSGTVIPAGRWNSGPIDAAWDIFFYEGEPFDPRSGSPEKIRWLNGDDHRIRIPLREGSRTFTFHFESTADLPVLGMNLFFDGKNDRPGISVFAPVAAKGPPYPEFKPNGADPTMGWPISDAPGSGSLSSGGAEVGIWAFESPGESLRATLTAHRIMTPPLAGNLDLVGPHALGPSGKPDWVGRFTLEVERYAPRPPDLALWLALEAGITLGSPGGEERWRARFGGGEIAPPFSFVLGGKPSREILKGWRKEASAADLDEGRRAVSLSYTDPSSGLVLRFEAIEYRDFRTAEWTVFMKNGGTSDSPLISDLRPLDARLTRRAGEEFLLRHWKGTFVRKDDYEPLATVLKPSSSLRFAPPGGRPCGHVFPYFNLETAGQGMIIVVSWGGQWAARFARDGDRGLQVSAGQETVRFVLHPGEEVRTPLIVIQPWKGGDWIDAQNAWRRWMVRYNIPRPGGKLPPLPQLAACSSHQFAEMINADESSQILFIDRYLEEGLKLDYWWMDAGWYVNEHGWPHTGTWEVDRKRFPRGLRFITDHGRKAGVKSIVWFEPERVAGGTWLSKNHPEWIIGGSNGGLLDLGIREARTWLTEHVDKIIVDEGIDLYRQDFNMDPLGSWRAKDAPDRQGITENHHVTGYLAYWDELRRRHPDMLIDSCASGGHRNDLETMRRAVPLLRSDYIFEPLGQQGHTYGLSFWLPFHGTAFSLPDRYDPYIVRSNMCPHNTGCFDVRRKDLDYGLIRRLQGERKAIAPYYFGDYYPLTPYSVEEDDWIAWQFHDPKAQAGAVQAFRRPKSSFFGIQLRLRGLDPGSTYEVTNLDAAGGTPMGGRDLMEKGLRVLIEDRPGSAAIVYKMKK